MLPRILASCVVLALVCPLHACTQDEPVPAAPAKQAPDAPTSPAAATPAVSAPATEPAASTAAVRLVAPLTKGAEFKLTYKVDNTVTSTMADKPPVTTGQSVAEYGLLIRITQASETGATADLVIESIKAAMKSPGPGGMVGFDSAKPASTDDKAGIGPRMRPLVGKRVVLELSPAAQILKLQDPDGVKKLPAAAWVNSVLDEGGVKSWLGPAFGIAISAEPVKAGDAWPRAWTMNNFRGELMGQGTDTFTLTLLDAERAAGTIAGTGHFLHKRAGIAEPDKSEFKKSGEFTWDLKGARLLSCITEETDQHTAAAALIRSTTKKTLTPRE